MSTALMQLTAGTGLTEYGSLIAAELAGEAAPQGLQLPRIKIAPGGIGQWQFPDSVVKSFDGIVMLHQDVRGYWPQKESGNAAPLCSSLDAVSGVFRPDVSKAEFEAAMAAKEPHPAVISLSHKQPLASAYACATCPLAEFGSLHQGQEKGKQGKGQACKKMVRMLVLPDGQEFPFILSLPPTSLKSWGAYYVLTRAVKDRAYFTVRTRFDLDVATTPTGIKYNTAKFSIVEALDLETVKAVIGVRHDYEEYIRKTAVDATEYDVAETGGNGTVVDSTAAPAERAPDDDIPF